MSASSPLPRSLIIFGVTLPLAVFIGYLMATPQASSSMAIVGLVTCILLLPLILKWHHPLLILTWNGAMNAFFLPGRPGVWMLLAGISLGVTVLGCVLNKEQKFQHVPAVTWSVFFLLAVVLITAKLTGGIGVRALGGSQYGGKRYVFIIAAIIGYFALSSIRIRPERVQLFAILFLLSGLTYAISNLAYVGGPNLWFLFYVFPVEFALSHAHSDFTIGESITRLAGVGVAALAICNALVLRYTVRGLLDLRRAWRLLLFVAAAAISLTGGFRSTLAMIGLLFLIQFCLERLHRTWMMFVLIGCTVIGLVVLIPFSSKLPFSIQRTLSVVPFLEIDPMVRLQAQATVDWRVEMWRVLLPEVRQYFFVGKGFAIDPTDLYLAEESMRRGFARDYYSSIVAGDYHSGPLSLIIPLGIFGAVAFLCILFTGGRVLYRNWKYGDPNLRNLNVFLFSLFLMKVIFYFVLFGSLYSDLAGFLGIIGFSIAANGGVCKPAEETQPVAVPASMPASAPMVLAHS